MHFYTVILIIGLIGLGVSTMMFVNGMMGMTLTETSILIWSAVFIISLLIVSLLFGKKGRNYGWDW